MCCGADPVGDAAMVGGSRRAIGARVVGLQPFSEFSPGVRTYRHSGGLPIVWYIRPVVVTNTTKVKMRRQFDEVELCKRAERATLSQMHKRA